MSWLRTNWLDALIFLLVALVMAGVVFFLTGVNPFSRFQGAGNTGQVSKPPVAQPAPVAKPPTEPPPVQPKPEVKPEVKATNPVTTKPATVKPETAAKPVTAKPVAQPPSTSKPVAVVKPATKPAVVQVKPEITVKQLDAASPRVVREPVVTLVPKTRETPPPAVPKPLRLPTQVTAQAVQPKPSRPTAAAPSRSVAAQQKPNSSLTARPAVRVSRGDTTGNWQVSAGSFANAVNAEALASRLRAQGWKAQVVRVGGYNRVYVGPYSSGSRARAAAAAIGSGARAFSGGAGVGAPPRAAPQTAARVTARPVEIRISTRPVYLQVGAYKNLQNAQPAINKLKAEGYPVQVLDGKLVRVRVGPVSNKTEVMAKLRRLGYSTFEVR